MGDIVEVTVNETTEVVEVAVIENGGGGGGSIDNPTGTGGYLRTSSGTWVQGVLKSVYDLFVAKYPTTATNGKFLQGNGTNYIEVDAPTTDLSGYATTSQLSNKVDKVTGKSLIDDTEIIRLAGVTNFDNSANITALANKVDKVAGKGLSTEDYTTLEKSKLASISTNATANSPDSTLLDRASHTGTQLSATIADFNTAVGSLVNNKVDNTRTVNSKPLSANITLNQDDILDGTTFKQYSLTEKNKLASITEIFTVALKTAYDSSVTWITTNGANLISHLTNTSNPHNVTAAQVGAAPINNPTFTGAVTLAQNAISPLQSPPLRQTRAEEYGWNKIIIFGDSRIQNESGTTSGVSYNYNRGVVNWANALLDRRFEVVANRGIGGNTTTQLVARYDTDVKPFAGSVKIVYMMIDINDVNADATEATITANLTTLYDKMTEDGFFIIDTAGYYPVTALSTARQRVFQKVAAFKKRQASIRNNLRVMDCHALIGNVTSTTPNSNANLMFDGTLHIGVRASQILGTELATYLSQLYPKTTKLITSAGDFRTTTDNSISRNVVANPLMVGNAGANGTGSASDASLDGGFVAGVATGFTNKRNLGAGTAVTSVGVNPNFVGQVQRIKITGETTAGATYQFAPTTASTTLINRGVDLVARCKVQLSNLAFVHTVMLRVLYTLDAVNYGGRDFADTNYVGGFIQNNCILTLETPIINIPTTGSLTNVEVQVLIIFDNTTARTGTATIDIGQLSFEQLT